MTSTSIARRIALSASLLLTPALAHAQWNLSADFSATNNPNGAWSFGSRNLGSLLSTGLSVYGAAYSSFGWDADWSAAPGSLPVILKNMDTSPHSWATIPLLLPGQVALHPGAGGDFSIARFTAPSAGSYAFFSRFTGLDCCATNTDVHVVVDGSSIFNGFVTGYGASQSYGSSVLLSAGSVVDFVVGFNGSYYNDTTGLDVTIDAVNAVPEPASFALVATGLLGMVGAVRRRV